MCGGGGGVFVCVFVCVCVCVCVCRCFGYTVEPLLKDSPNKGHHINYLPTKDTL